MTLILAGVDAPLTIENQFTRTQVNGLSAIGSASKVTAALGARLDGRVIVALSPAVIWRAGRRESCDSSISRCCRCGRRDGWATDPMGGCDSSSRTARLRRRRGVIGAV